ncbi:Pleiotropic drug resistance protein 1, partial [Mucuna pruriens]
MEDGGSVKAGSIVSSFRIGSSVWSNSGVEIFANSFHQEDDEEALKWAAIQKLPTVARLRTGLLTSPQGVASEIDIHQLGLQERRDLLERLVRVAQEDNETFMLKLRDRVDRVGISLPTIEVRFENMNVGAEVHVGSRALPTFTNYMVNKVEGLLNFLHVLPSRKQHINILQNVSGIIRPARMTLLLGPPSSGKTTLLLALAGGLDSKLKVTYNGHGMNEFVPQQTAAYVNLLAEVSRREKEANITPDPDIDVYMKAVATEGQKANFITDYILRILGLEVCADTIMGNAMLRGISGGQRKRVTTGEMLVGPAKALFMDEISTGLDSSTTFQVVNSLEHFIHSLKGIAVVSLLQPAPEIYNLFDDIILLSNGQIVYQGPCEHVLEFFTSMGFKCPERKGVADFLQEVTSRKDQEQYWVHTDQPYRFVTTKEFVEAFQSFHVGRSLANELATQFHKSKSHPAALTTKMYGLGKWELLKACLSREYLLMKRNSFVHIFQLCQVVAFITMTVFFRTEMHRDSVTSGGIYAVSKLPVFYKQRDFLFFPSWIYALPAWILKIPMTFAQVGIWVFLTYYVIGFDPNVGRFFRQFLLLLFVNQMASSLFWFIGALGRELTAASTIGSFVLAILIAMSGFILSKAIAQHHAVKSEQSQSNEQDGGSTSTKSSSKRKEADRRKGMVLPFEPRSITFDDVTYFVDMPQEMKNQGVLEDRLELLKGVSGAFRPGVLTALMGSTGAGKTTLMDVLAGRKTGGYIGGNITISGYPKKQETFARISGYCEQNDIHSPYVTVYESLLYSAWLRLSAEISSETRKMFIEEVIELVELNPLRHAIVGLPGVNGLSTEQRKRLTIAVELVANPSIIFMDEPTSGLDARAAAIVIRAVRNIVDTGRTVVCTIHQPSIDIFESFDELFLMKRGGQEIYVGSLGHHSSHLISYFKGIQGVRTIEDGYNPATWMLEVTNSAKEMELGIDFAEVYKNSELYRRNKELIKELSTPAPGSKVPYFPSKYSRSFITQYMACLWKQHWSYWRNNQYTAQRFLYTIAVALLFGSIYWNLGSKIKKQQDLFNSMGFMYTAVLLLGIKNANSAQPLVAVERTVVIELPHVLLQTVVYCVIVYAMVGFEWTVTKFFWYLFFMYFTFLYFTYYGMMSAAMTPNPSIAVILSSGFYEIWNLFAGFVIPRPRIPVWWRWNYWANPVAWTLYGLVASQFGDMQDPIQFNDTSTKVEDFLRNYFGFKHDFLGVVASVLVGFAVTFALIFAIAIKMFNFQRR